MQRAPVKPERADPRGEHGRRQEAVAPSTSSRATARRCSPRRSSPTSRSAACCARPPPTSRRSRGPARTARSRAGMQSVAFTPASAIAAIFAATGQDLGMVGTSSMAHGTGAARRGRPAGVDPLRRARGRHRRRRHDAALGARLARVDRLRRRRQGLPLRADRRRGGALPRDQRLGRDGDRRQRELLPGAPRARRPAVIALVFRYEVRDPDELRARPTAPTASGRSSSAQGAGYIGTELLRDVEEPDRYLVIDRWESAEAYNAFLAAHQARVPAAQRRVARSTTSRSCGSGRSRTSGMRTIPPHHDPACWGCGDNPTGLHLPLPAAEGLTEYEAYFSFDERHQGGPGHRARRARRGARSTRRSACSRPGTRSRP